MCVCVQWSFGVTCWEIFSSAKTPYPGIHPTSLIAQLENGERLPKPNNAACCDSMYVCYYIGCMHKGHKYVQKCQCILHLDWGGAGSSKQELSLRPSIDMAIQALECWMCTKQKLLLIQDEMWSFGQRAHHPSLSTLIDGISVINAPRPFPVTFAYCLYVASTLCY